MSIPVQELIHIVSEGNVLLDEPMAAHTTFRVGGPADCYVVPQTIEELRKVVTLLAEKGVPCFILGNGSNLLAADEGFRGVIVKVGANLSDVRVEGERIIAAAGASMHKTAQAALDSGLTGLEFASGIPGTVGGGVIMNAGAYNGEMSFVVESVKILTPEGREILLTNEEMKFDYRYSILKGTPNVVTEVTFSLRPGEKTAIREMMEDFACRRRDKQPLEYPSAGSTFKRPKDNFAGKLIQDAGLRGYSVGGAQVSEKHCGFVINTGNATARDIRELISHVQAEVKAQFDVELETEVLFLGWE